MRRTVYCPHNYFLFALLFVVLLSVISLLLIGVVGKALQDVGFSPVMTATVLVLTFIGSYINLPLVKMKTQIPIIEETFVKFFGMVYRIPHVRYGEKTTMVAINVGGALIPVFISLYLLWKQPSTLPYAFVGIAIVSVVTHIIAKPVKGVGITMPPFIAPLIAALLAYILPSGAPTIIAYVSGVLGTLIGADVSKIHIIPKLGAPVTSIGGAGTFDGVFLSGIIAVLLL